ncbi:MAG: GNAT family protein [Bacteroidia bacterium]
MEKIIINSQYHLSQITHNDIPKLVEYCNDIEIYNNTLLIPYPYLEKDAVVFLNWIEAKQTEFGAPVVFAIRNVMDELVGITGLVCKYNKDSHKEEIGYWMGKPFRGNGITTAAVKKFTDYLFSNRKYIRIEAQTYMHNTASQKVLEKAGFEFEGILKKNFVKKGVYIDNRLFAKIKDE